LIIAATFLSSIAKYNDKKLCSLELTNFDAMQLKSGFRSHDIFHARDCKRSLSRSIYNAYVVCAHSSGTTMCFIGGKGHFIVHYRLSALAAGWF